MSYKSPFSSVQASRILGRVGNAKMFSKLLRLSALWSLWEKQLVLVVSMFWCVAAVTYCSILPVNMVGHWWPLNHQVEVSNPASAMDCLNFQSCHFQRHAWINILDFGISPTFQISKCLTSQGSWWREWTLSSHAQRWSSQDLQILSRSLTGQTMPNRCVTLGWHPKSQALHDLGDHKMGQHIGENLKHASRSAFAFEYLWNADLAACFGLHVKSSIWKHWPCDSHSLSLTNNFF